MKPLVIFHGNCADGFTSAWLANMYFHPVIEGDDLGPDAWYVDAVPGVYGQNPPDVKDREVFILDFSYPPEVMDKLSKSADTITVIDHHETAVRRLAGHSWGNVKKVLDIKRSGAYLTAKYFWPHREPDDMIKLVSDRDLWRFKDKRTKPFSMGLFSYPYGIREWNYASRNIEQLVKDGEAIERKHQKDIAELIEVMATQETIGGFIVPSVNLPYTMASDACDKLLEQNGGAPFAASWYLRKDGKRVYSLRSRPTGVNVAEVAETYGGGGHANAAGFTL